MDRKAGENTSPERLSWSAANLGLASKPFLAGSMVQMWAKGNIEDPSFGSSRPRPVPNRLSRPVSDRGPSFCESRVKPSQSRGASRGRRVSSAETISQKKKKDFRDRKPELGRPRQVLLEGVFREEQIRRLHIKSQKATNLRAARSTPCVSKPTRNTVRAIHERQKTPLDRLEKAASGLIGFPDRQATWYR